MRFRAAGLIVRLFNADCFAGDAACPSCFFCAAHRLRCAAAILARAAALIVLRVPWVCEPVPALPPSIRLISAIFEVTSPILCPRPTRAASRIDRSILRFGIAGIVSLRVCQFCCPHLDKIWSNFVALGHRRRYRVLQRLMRARFNPRIPRCLPCLAPQSRRYFA
jgi:hypothetical protein